MPRYPEPHRLLTVPALAVAAVAATATAELASVVATGASRRVGATAAETALALPGDELVPHPDVQADRARTVDTPAWEVWPWLAQLGQDEAGFVSEFRSGRLIGRCPAPCYVGAPIFAWGEDRRVCVARCTPPARPRSPDNVNRQ